MSSGTSTPNDQRKSRIRKALRRQGRGDWDVPMTSHNTQRMATADVPNVTSIWADSRGREVSSYRAGRGLYLLPRRSHKLRWRLHNAEVV